MSYNGENSHFWCQECKTDEIVIGCPFCLKYKIEDLKEYRKDLLNERNRTEMYSDRVEINRLVNTITKEIELRERNL